jgi:hypothetical protein
MRIGWAGLALGVGLCTLGCSSGPSDALRLLPQNPAVVVYVPSIGRLYGDIGLLAMRLSRGQGMALLPRSLATLSDGLDLDVRDPNSLAAVGLDPARGSAAAFGAHGELVLVVAVSDAGAFEAYLERELLRGPAARVVDLSRDSETVHAVRDGDKGAVRLAWGAAAGFEVVASGGHDPGAAVAAALGGDDRFDLGSPLGDALVRAGRDADVAVSADPRGLALLTGQDWVGESPLVGELASVVTASAAVDDDGVDLHFETRYGGALAARQGPEWIASWSRYGDGQSPGASIGDGAIGALRGALQPSLLVKLSGLLGPDATNATSSGASLQVLERLVGDGLTGRFAVAVYRPQSASAANPGSPGTSGSPGNDDVEANIARTPVAFILEPRDAATASHLLTSLGGLMSVGLGLTESHGKSGQGSRLVISDDGRNLFAGDVIGGMLVLGTVSGVDRTRVPSTDEGRPSDQQELRALDGAAADLEVPALLKLLRTAEPDDDEDWSDLAHVVRGVGRVTAVGAAGSGGATLEVQVVVGDSLSESDDGPVP